MQATQDEQQVLAEIARLEREPASPPAIVPFPLTHSPGHTSRLATRRGDH